MAGVGIGTVSRVINHGPAVRADTARLVRQAMERLGYEPAPPSKRRGPRLGERHRASLPATERSVALILGQRGLRWVLDCAPVFSYVIHGIERALAEADYHLIIRQADEWRSAQQVVQQSRCSGLIFFADEPLGALPEALRQIPTVWVMGSPHRFAGDHVQPDHVRCGIMAAKFALAQGHRRCAVLGTGLGSPGASVLYRNDAFRWTVEQAGGEVALGIDPDAITISTHENAANFSVCAELIDRLLAMPRRATALFVEADALAPTVYRLLAERGIRPQRDITVITCNNERPYLLDLRPQPVIVDLQAEFIGRRAVEQLFWRFTHPAEPAMRIMIEPVLRNAL